MKLNFIIKIKSKYSSEIKCEELPYSKCLDIPYLLITGLRLRLLFVPIFEARLMCLYSWDKKILLKHRHGEQQTMVLFKSPTWYMAKQRAEWVKSACSNFSDIRHFRFIIKSKQFHKLRENRVFIILYLILSIMFPNIPEILQLFWCLTSQLVKKNWKFYYFC